LGIKPSTDCSLRQCLAAGSYYTKQAVALAEADQELKVANESGNTVVASASNTVVTTIPVGNAP
jgi:hypothetical protein